MITVINRHHTIYVGRGTPLGNPFIVGEDGDRKRVIEKYSKWLDEQILYKNRSVCNELNRVYKLARYYDVLSNCSCKGFSPDCHADIIKKLIDSKL